MKHIVNVFLWWAQLFERDEYRRQLYQALRVANGWGRKDRSWEKQGDRLVHRFLRCGADQFTEMEFRLGDRIAPWAIVMSRTYQYLRFNNPRSMQAVFTLLLADMLRLSQPDS